MQQQDRMGQQFGNYRLTRQIGRGGSAEVYLAEDIRTRNEYAIKVLTGTNLKDYQHEEFLQEARVVANLQHLSAHIVHVFDFGVQFDESGMTESGVPYFVMAYAPQGNLRKRHPRGTQVPLERILLYVKHVAEALQCAHNHVPPVVHLDVKPENMLLRDFDYVWLSDFGIAFMGETGQLPKPTDTVFATVAYIAPERIAGQTRRASDQYSLGIVVYEWLCGQPPFRGTAMEICDQHVKVAPAPLYPMYPHVTQQMDAVVGRALAKNPDDRYRSVQDFAEALEEAIEAALRLQEQAKPVAEVDTTLADAPTVAQMQHDKLMIPSQSPLLPSGQPSQPSRQALAQSPLLSSTSSASSPHVQAPFPPLPVQASSSSQSKPDIHAIAELFAPPQRPVQAASVQSPLPPSTPSASPPPQGTSSAQSSLPSSTPPAQLPLPLNTPSAPAPSVQSSFPLFPIQTPSPSQSKPDIHGIAELFSPPPSQSMGSQVQTPWSNPPQRPKTRILFDSSAQFEVARQQRLFRTSGMVLNALAALLLFFLLRHTYTLLGGIALALLGGFYSYYMFRWCIRAVREAVAIFFGAMVALYWGFIGEVIGGFLAPLLHQSAWISSIFIAVLFFVASLSLHIRYVSKKSW